MLGRCACPLPMLSWSPACLVNDSKSHCRSAEASQHHSCGFSAYPVARKQIRIHHNVKNGRMRVEEERFNDIWYLLSVCVHLFPLSGGGHLHGKG